MTKSQIDTYPDFYVVPPSIYCNLSSNHKNVFWDSRIMKICIKREQIIFLIWNLYHGEVLHRGAICHQNRQIGQIYINVYTVKLVKNWLSHVLTSEPSQYFEVYRFILYSTRSTKFTIWLSKILTFSPFVSKWFNFKNIFWYFRWTLLILFHKSTAFLEGLNRHKHYNFFDWLKYCRRIHVMSDV